MSDAGDRDRLPTLAFILLMAAVFAVYVGYGVVLPVLPFVLESLLGAGARLTVAWHTGLIAGVYMFALFVGAPLWGRLSDRIGRRPVILVGLGGCVVALVLFGAADRLWLAYFARALGGALVSAVLPVALAYVSETSGPEARARRFAWMTAASTVGFLLGPVLGGWLVDVPGAAFSLPFWVAAAAGAVIWMAIWSALPEAAPHQVPAARRASSERPARDLNRLLLLALLGMFGLGSFEVALALHGAQVLGLDPWRIGVLFMVCSVVMVLVQVLVFSPLVRRLGFAQIAAPAFALMAMGLLVLPFASTFGVVATLVGLIAAGSAVVVPMLAYRVSLRAGRAQGSALGRQTAAASLGQGLGSAAAGGLYGITPETPFWLTAALLLVGALLSLTIGRRAMATAG